MLPASRWGQSRRLPAPIPQASQEELVPGPTTQAPNARFKCSQTVFLTRRDAAQLYSSWASALLICSARYFVALLSFRAIAIYLLQEKNSWAESSRIQSARMPATCPVIDKKTMYLLLRFDSRCCCQRFQQPLFLYQNTMCICFSPCIFSPKLSRSNCKTNFH